MHPVLLPLLLLAPTALARPSECIPTRIADVNSALDDVEAAFKRMDGPHVMGNISLAESALSCLETEVDAATAARFHRTRALEYFQERDTTGVQGSFTAALAADPTATLSDDIAPKGHPLLQYYAAWDGLAPAAPVPVPTGFRVKVDGRDTNLRSPNAPAIVQVFGRDGSLVFSRWLAPDESMPQMTDTGALADLPALRQVGNLPAESHAWTPGLVGAGVGTLAAVACVVGGAVTWGAYRDNTDPEKAPGILDANHAFLVSSGVVGTAAVGMGVAAFVVRW